MILSFVTISFSIIALQTLLASSIPVLRLIERNSIFADHRNCSYECRAARHKIAEYLVYSDYDTNYNLIGEVDARYGALSSLCPLRRKSDRFYSYQIFARSVTWSVEQCALVCLALPDCHSFNHVDFAKACYYSKGPYKTHNKTITEKFYVPPSYLAYARHFVLACRRYNIGDEDSKRRLSTSKIFHPGKPSFKPAERPLFDHGQGRYYQVPHSSPWMVNLKIKKERCSGVFIPSSRFNTSQSDLILTTARCVTISKSTNPVLVEDIQAQFGKNSLRINEYSLVEKPIEKIAIYPLYDGYPEHGNDLALLKLKEPVKYDKYATPIKFPIKYKPYSYADCYTTGWETFLQVKRGSITERTRDKFLQRFDVHIVDDKRCFSLWGQTYNRSTTTYCAELKIHKTHLGCKVDDGSPLTCFEDGRYVLYGLANYRSLHRNCKKFDFTHLGIKIPYVLGWIYDQDRRFAGFPSLPAPTIQSPPIVGGAIG